MGTLIVAPVWRQISGVYFKAMAQTKDVKMNKSLA